MSIAGCTTDGRVAGCDLAVLADDPGALSVCDAVVIAGPRLAAGAPDVLEALAGLDGVLDAERMRGLNWQVDEGGRRPAEVAAGFLAGLD